jgi:hypothetical protein
MTAIAAPVPGLAVALPAHYPYRFDILGHLRLIYPAAAVFVVGATLVLKPVLKSRHQPIFDGGPSESRKGPPFQGGPRILKAARERGACVHVDVPGEAPCAVLVEGVTLGQPTCTSG